MPLSLMSQTSLQPTLINERRPPSSHCGAVSSSDLPAAFCRPVSDFSFPLTAYVLEIAVLERAAMRAGGTAVIVRFSVPIRFELQRPIAVNEFHVNPGNSGRAHAVAPHGGVYSQLKLLTC